ncbi:MAG: 2-dehydropantoate 2-reductase [Thermoplasmata archaeon]
MRILVFGAGAMGSFFGGMLSLRHEVILVGRADHMQAVRAHGLRISGKTVMIARPRTASRVPRGARPELVLVTTKAYDTASAMTQLKAFAKSATFLTLQNGVDNPDVIARTASRVLAGTTAHGVTFMGPGNIRHAGVGDTVVGPWVGTNDTDATHARDILADAGISARVSADIRTELWAKVVVNASINPLAALAAVPNGRLVRDRRLLAVLERVAREAAAVAREEGARIDADEIVHRALLVARRTASNRASMLQDLDRHRRTEIDAITGAIVAAGEKTKVDTPLNRALFALVKAKETALLEGGAG